jgi:glycogen debranching enzyme
MEDVIRLSDQFYIIAESDRAAKPTRVLKQGETFAVFDLHGDLAATGQHAEHGLYHEGTRFLSRLELLLGDRQPLLLSSTVRQENDLFTADLTNPDVSRDDAIVVARGELHIYRSRVLWQGVLYEWMRVTNYALQPLEIPLTLRFGADFADIFEVRGMARARRGTTTARVHDSRAVRLEYRGLDNVVRVTRIVCDPAPDTLTAEHAGFVLALPPRASTSLLLTVACHIDGQHPELVTFEAAADAALQAQTAGRQRACHVYTANEGVNDWVNRSAADLQMMTTETSAGLYPYAGVPWFSTVFGRDGLITAFEMLWADPDVARGVLGFLAATQADAESATSDAEPGKILHEVRGGEMAALGEVPFARYYGTVDATPLFVMLADAYYERTGDQAFVRFLWPHVERALNWMRTYGDRDGDGFIEYARRSEKGLVQQGWKDSNDSIFHADGSMAEPPIALCEVQGYAYGAWSGAARLAARMGLDTDAAAYAARAAALRDAFDRAFWCDDTGTYALALDGLKRRCRVRASNAGHCLFTGIARQDRAVRVAAALMDEDGFSGWGVRTISAREARYNPMSYHNGSVWPHDNALVAAGLARYGLTDHLMRLMSGLFDMSLLVDLHRLPELVCGFHRRTGEAPTLYPVACAPQAWAAGSVYMLLQSALGLSISAPERRITFRRGALPPWLGWIRLERLTVGEASVDLVLERHEQDLGVKVERRTGDLEIVAVK